MYRIQLISFIIIAFISYGCNDPITIGDDIDEPIDLQYNDDVILDTKTVTGEITATYNLGINYTTYLIGQLDDPYFGKSTSDIYLQIGYGATIPDFDDGVLDSVILVMEYDTLGIYGDTTAVYDFEVYQMDEIMTGDTLLADTTFAVLPTIVGSKSIRPAPYDSVTIANYLGEANDSITLKPQLRIPMTTEFAEMVFNADSVNYASSDNILDFINGLRISAITENSMMGFNIGDNTNLAGTNGLRVYYTSADGEATEYNFTFRSRTFSHFDHDVSGAIVENYLADEDFNNDDFAFYQGMSGVETEIRFDGIRDFSNTIINNAKLIYYSTELPEATSNVYSPVRLTTATYINTDGDRVLTTDATLGISPGPYSTAFGGFPEEIGDSKIYRHEINMTNHIYNIFNDPELDTKITLTPLQRSETSSRTIIFGSGSVDYKPVLKLVYTTI